MLLPAVTRINRTEIGFRSGAAQTEVTGGEPGGRDMPNESLMLTGDENIIDINLTVFWKIKQNPADYLFSTRDPDNLVKAIAESSIREVIGRTPIQPALTQLRAQIETDVHNQTQQILDRYHAGIDITQVQLQRVDPPDAVIESFRDVQRANTDAERMRNEARGLSQRHRAAREGRRGAHHRRRPGCETGFDRPGDRADTALPVGVRAIPAGEGCDAAAHVHRDDAGHPDAVADTGGG